MWKGARRASQAPKHKATARKRIKKAPSKVALQRRRIRALKIAGVFSTVVLFFGFLSWLSFLPALSVQAVSVEGVTSVKPLSITSYAQQATASASLGFFSRQNILLYPAEELESELLFEIPRLATVALDRKLFAREVIVFAEERSPYVIWCAQQEKEECYFADESGFVYEAASVEPDAIFTVLYGGVRQKNKNTFLRERIQPGHFEEIHSFLEELQRLGLFAESVTLEGNDAYVKVASGWELRIALEKDLGAVAFNLEALLESDEFSTTEKLEYIDMRFDERVYYAFREEADTQE